MTASWISIVLALFSALFIFGGLRALFVLRGRNRRALSSATFEEDKDKATAHPLPVPSRQDAERQAQAAAFTGPDLVLTQGMARSQASLWGRLSALISGRATMDAALLEELEAVLLTSDLGVGLSTRLLGQLNDLVATHDDCSAQARTLLRRELLAALAPNQNLGDPLALGPNDARPRVILFVGVNGVGKTTTIGKVAQALTSRGHKVVLAAGDTFRAAAAEQLAVWAQRAQARVVRGSEGADPASVMFNAIQAAKSDGADFVLADTAGRLHNKAELMDEIKKIRRAVGRVRQGAPDETWLVVDATTGQNALNQAQQFHEAIGVSGLVLTKLDGTAKGGVIVSIVDNLKIPVRLVGLGEGADALRVFEPEAFVQALV